MITEYVEGYYHACSQCGAFSPLAFSPRDADQVAIDDGWLVVGQVAVCPNCYPKIKEAFVEREREVWESETAKLFAVIYELVLDLELQHEQIVDDLLAKAEVSWETIVALKSWDYRPD